MVPARSRKVSRVSRYSGSDCAFSPFAYGAFTLFGGTSQTLPLGLKVTYVVRTPKRTRFGLGSSGFARRYSRNHSLFSLPPATLMFQFTGFPSQTYGFGSG